MTADTSDGHATSTEGTVTVTETGTGGTYTQRITAGPHQLFADEPLPIGDDEGGPTPTTCCWPVLGGRAPR